MNFTLVRPRTLQAKRARRAAIVREVLARKNSSAVAVVRRDVPVHLEEVGGRGLQGGGDERRR